MLAEGSQQFDTLRIKSRLLSYQNSALNIRLYYFVHN